MISKQHGKHRVSKQVNGFWLGAVDGAGPVLLGHLSTLTILQKTLLVRIKLWLSVPEKEKLEDVLVPGVLGDQTTILCLCFFVYL